MHVHPQIAALRGNRAPQRCAQKGIERALHGWMARPAMQALQNDLQGFGAGARLEHCPQLEAVFTQQGEAEQLIGAMSGHFCAALQDNWLGHPPFRNGYTGSVGSLLLAQSARAQIILQSREPGTYPAASHIFSDGVRFDAVLGGSASAQIVRLVGKEHQSEQAGALDGALGGARGGARGCFAKEDLTLGKGARLALDLTRETAQVTHVRKRLVVLRLLRSAPDPQPSCEYDASSGAFLHQSAGTLATSRQEATLALLGRMRRADAAPVMARLALRKGDASLRWQALRECLALDTKEGFGALCAIARKPADPLSAPAGALRAQLIEQHPQLAAWEASQCPA